MARYQAMGQTDSYDGVEYVEAPAALFDLVTEGTIDNNQPALRWRVPSSTTLPGPRVIPPG